MRLLVLRCCSWLRLRPACLLDHEGAGEISVAINTTTSSLALLDPSLSSARG